MWISDLRVLIPFLLQVFLTSRAVYVIVFNLCQDLEEVHHSWDRNTNEVRGGGYSSYVWNFIIRESNSQILWITFIFKRCRHIYDNTSQI